MRDLFPESGSDHDPVNRDWHFQIGEESRMKVRPEEIPTICNICHSCCGMLVTVENGVIRRIRGNPEHPQNAGRLCPKGALAKDMVYSPHRLTQPLRRIKGELKPVSWDDALNFIAEKLLDMREKYGSEGLVTCRGAPVGQECHDALHQLSYAYGSTNITGPAHLCSVPRRLGMQLVYGERTEPEYEGTKCVLIWGANPSESYRLGESAVYGGFDDSIKRASKNGAKIIVIDPRRTPVASFADEWIKIRPGTDAALAMAMLHLIMKENLYDKDFVENWTAGFAQLARQVETATPEWASRLTGITVETINRLARTYASLKPATIREGNGLDQHINVVDTVRLIGILPAVTGNLDIPGGNVFYPLPRLADYPTVRPQGKRLGSEKYPLFPTAAFPVFVDALLSGQPYRPRAMFVYHSNPVLINANYKRVLEALKRLELLVVDDIYMTATAQIADVVLPGACDFEQPSFRVYSSREGAFVCLRRKLVEPPGQARPIMETEYELARLMGLAETYPWKTTTEWINYRLKPVEVKVSDLEQKTLIHVTPHLQYQKYLKAGFKTPSGKVELSSEKVKNVGLNLLPVYLEPPGPVEYPDLARQYPLIGTTHRPGNYVHTRFRNIPSFNRLEPDALLRLHPEDAIARGIASGDKVEIASPEGAVMVKSLVTDEVGPGVVIMDFGWGNPGDGGANVNVLTSDSPRDPFCGATANRCFICQVKKLPYQ